ncbi:hypothetical protein PV328_006325 [Microctonus aethiopoides]|uniref:Uncharacterized protein n=1 Tax=Microctonus aethiopoides TaxID=144406 RepID=A0AA39FPL6_9HYME|nr:hypothetical protein PV328_006325 [Microctonus aethiopoides]
MHSYNPVRGKKNLSYLREEIPRDCRSDKTLTRNIPTDAHVPSFCHQSNTASKVPSSKFKSQRVSLLPRGKLQLALFLHKYTSQNYILA